ncbi:MULTISPECIES: prepilin peptidase [unclassified Vibrio]|uniref:A24 family peptidase n=1 Tax=Vibrio sp. 624788 TaxID=1234362 RepID=UPI001F4CEE8B|nr:MULTISPECIES: prepilin peptidase [unclassified Vibrio]
MWLVILATTSIYIIYSDVRYRRISNLSVCFVTFSTIPLFLTYGSILSVGSAIGIILIGVLLNFFSLLGAGDTKVLAAFALVITPEFMLPTILLVLVLGGIMAAGYLVYMLLTGNSKIRKRGIPYGVPICIGGILGVLASSLSIQ